MEKPTLEHLLAERINARILDVGTGAGDFIQVLRGAPNYASITGIDVDEKRIEATRTAFAGTPLVDFKVMDSRHLDWSEETFDIVAISNSLHHLSDIRAVLAEMSRVLKRGGLFVISEMYADYDDEKYDGHKLYHSYAARIDRLNGICHNEELTREQMDGYASVLPMTILASYECAPDSKIDLSTEEMDELAAKLRAPLNKISTDPEKAARLDDFSAECENAIQTIRSNGLWNPPLHVIVGEKK